MSILQVFGSQLLLPGQLGGLVGLQNEVLNVPLHAVASSSPMPHLDVVAILIAHARQPGREQPATDALTVRLSLFRILFLRTQASVY